MMNDGFVKADSRNLPSVETVMILEYMAINNSHNIAEITGAKALMTSRDSYVDSAVGYVELKRVSGDCIVRAKIVPEHRLSNKLYNVAAKINETADSITESTCEDCAAAAGGCKHSLLLLFWLVKRSSEASTTSVQCYWTRPKLSSARTENVQTKAIFNRPTKIIKLTHKDSEVVPDFLQECKLRSLNNSLIASFHEKNTDNVNIFDLAIDFIEEVPMHNFENFFNYGNRKINKELKQLINKKTKGQSDSKLWHNVRQGRITASRLYEAAHCTTDGALVQQILVGYKIPETAAIKRGKLLEGQVIKEIEKKLKITIKKCGFLIINLLFGASPDGVSEDFVVEVKCPTTDKSFTKYVKDSKINKKFEAQVLCQVMATNKSKGLFCVASPLFERNKKIDMYWIDYDEEIIDDLIFNATQFWKRYIFPKIILSAKE